MRHPPAPRYHPLVVRNFATGAKVCEVPLNDPNLSSFEVKVPEAGFYSLKAEIGQRHAFRLVKSVLPVAYYAMTDAQDLWSSVGNVWFYAPKGAKFAFMPSGTEGERIQATICTPTGSRAWHEGAIGNLARFQPDRPVDGLWKVEVARPESPYAMDDFRLDLTGIPGVMFLSDKKYWRE